ncbi:MAG: nucleotidyltransferase domain-containing protein [Actinoallomurus sp.]
MVAAFLGGSYAAGRARGDSDIDLYLITEPNHYATFLEGRDRIMHSWGEPRTGATRRGPWRVSTGAEYCRVSPLSGRRADSRVGRHDERHTGARHGRRGRPPSRERA